LPSFAGSPIASSVTKRGSNWRAFDSAVEFGGGHRWDLYLKIAVHIPERLTTKQRELYHQLRTLETSERESESAAV
jgi:DnaJ-class molecular chaperone